MPKNKKPAGGRPAKDFTPRKSAGKNLGGKSPRGAAAPGSRSPKHRGYQPEPVDAPAKKARWTADERAAKGRTPDRRESSRRDEERPRREHGTRDHVAGGVYARDTHEHSGRGGRQHVGGTRKPVGRSGERDDRARYERSERPRYERDDFRSPGRRSAPTSRNRSEMNDSYSDGARPRYERSDRPRYERDDFRSPGRRSAPTSRNRSETNDSYRDGARPRRDFNDRPRRDFDDRPRRDSGSQFYPDKSDRGFTPQDDVVLERLQAEAIEATDVANVSFADLGLGSNIVRELSALGADAPFPIQAATIPVVLSGRDVLGRGRTGSGKTIAFGAPTVERLMENKGGTKRAMGRAPRALIMAPTRELALQIDRTVQPIARSVGLFTTQIYGGVPQGRQVGALQRGVDIVIGTPGRIEDLIQQRKLDLSQVQIVVLDEADHMCDLGFLEPVQRILRLTAPDSQKLLFSATLDTGVAALVDEFLVDPAVHEVAGEDQASSTIDHRVLVVDHRDKRDIIVQLADRDGKTLIFSRTRAFAEDLCDYLEDNGLRAVALHGDLNQNRRTRNLAQLSSGRVDVLVATDVAARGIHVDDIDLVIQADAPDEYKTYLHRSGRTGRAGQHGTVVTLIPRQRQRRMADLLNRAEIEVDFADARLGDAILTEIAQGARGNATAE